MGASFKVRDYKDGKIIILNSSSYRSKYLFSFYAFVFFSGAIGFLFSLFNRPGDSVIADVILLAGIIAFSIGFLRFANKASESERLFVNKQSLGIISSSLFKTITRSYEVADISEFRLLGREKFTPHPLHVGTFDYLGFQTEQEVVEDLYSEGKISFMYQGRQIRFGKEVFSWEFEELEILLYDVTGNDFRYTDKYERDNFPEN